MKKYIYLSLLASCISLHAAEQKEVTVNGGGASRVSITATNSDTEEINLVANSTGGSMYKANGKTIRSLQAINSTAENGKGGFNIANTESADPSKDTALTIDINSTTKDTTAIDVAWWSQNWAKVFVRNSASSTTAINLNFGEEFKVFGGGQVQKQQFTFDNITANVNVATVKLGSNHKADTTTLQVTNTATVNLNSGMEIGGNSNAPVLVDVAGKLVTTGDVNVGANSKFDISGVYQNKTGSFYVKNGGEVDISGTFNQGGNVYIQSYSVVNVLETGTYNAKVLSISSGCTLNVYGEMIVAPGASLTLNGAMNLNKRTAFYTINSTGGNLVQSVADDTLDSANRGIQICRTATLNSADWTVDEVLILKGNYVKGTDLDKTTAKLYLNDSWLKFNKRDGVTPSIVLYNMSQMYLNSEEGIIDDDTGVSIVVAADDADVAKDQVAAIYLNSNQRFANINMSQNLNLYLDELSTLTLTSDDTIILSDPNSILSIYGFKDNRIYVGENNSIYNVLNNIKAYGDLHGESLISSLTVQNGWLIGIAVPEPAEWAMIFGGIALGLAIYRRRK